jgi:Domain of unknown function (DUF4347)
MSLHLLIVAQHEPTDDEFDLAFELAEKTADDFRVAWCRSPGELIDTMRKAVTETLLEISTLDIYGHGSMGRQKLGEDVLFDAYDENGIARSMRKFLTPDAHVRLLGCTTALGDPGRKLLQDVRNALGEARVVYGTIVNCEACIDFGPRGLLAEMEDEYLFSSTEAISRKAPNQVERQEELGSWFAEARRP